MEKDMSEKLDPKLNGALSELSAHEIVAVCCFFFNSQTPIDIIAAEVGLSVADLSRLLKRKPGQDLFEFLLCAFPPELPRRAVRLIASESVPPGALPLSSLPRAEDGSGRSFEEVLRKCGFTVPARTGETDA